MTPLPIDILIPEILQTIRLNPFVILTATPGAGKTTRLPPALLDVVAGKVLVLEPRRVATVAAATRICQEREWKLGGVAGYQVRFDAKVTRDTRLIFMTDALLLRRMIEDPELRDVGLVVIDEFHERNLNQDLILGALRELRELGREIKVLVMSATLDVERLRRFLPGAAVVDVPGQVFPLEVRFGITSARPIADFAFVDRVADAVIMAERESASGDILVFLPGVGEIARVGERLRARSQREILSLHGSLPLSEQQRVLQPSPRARVILSTNVAEASVTVPGVNFVIDSGLAKTMEMNTRTGFSTLETTRIALFNARQRAGRAARLSAGTCFRLWTEFDEATMREEPLPEVARTDLSPALLWLAHLGISDFRNFAWFDPPPGPLLMWADRALKSLGALDKQNQLTDFGRRLLVYPLAPRLGAMLMRGEEWGIGSTAARLAAILNDRDFADQGEVHANTECDMLLRLDLLREHRGQAILESARQLERLVKGGEGDELDVRRLLLHTHLDRLCRCRAGSERAVMVGGRGVRLSPRSQVRKSEFFVALQGMDMPNQPDTTIHLASGFSKEFLLTELRDQIRVVEDVYYDADKAQFFARRQRFIEDLAIDEPSLAPANADAVHDDFVQELLARWEEFARYAPLAAWIQRARFLAHHDSRFADPLDANVREEFLRLATFGQTKLSEVFKQDLLGLLETVVPGDVAQTLRREVPRSFTAPSGVAHDIRYDELHSAYVDVRLQELFGLLTTPKIIFGAVPLTFRILGPNYRPVQVTADLGNFWRTGYREVRQELRLRYPKHSWPEDPYSAKPEAKGRRRF